jgi:OOP family OmpA-OmpF porin
MRKAITLVAMLLFTFSVMADNVDTEGRGHYKDTTKVKYNSLYLGLNGGFQQFYGDIHNDIYFPGSFKQGSISWYGGARLGYQFNQYWGLQGGLSYGKLYSEDNNRLRYFDASLLDYNLSVLFNMTSLVAPKIYSKKWYVYTSLGFGGLHHRTGLYDSNDDSFVDGIGYDASGSKTKMNFERSYNFGAGFNYRLTEHLDIGIEIDLLHPGFDQLDALPITLSELDRYSHTGVQVTYTFGNNENAWKWNPMDPELKELTNRLDDLEERMDTAEADIAELKKCKCEMDNLPDDDQDGIPNEFDLEPNTPANTLVNFQGIAIPTMAEVDSLNKIIADGGAGGPGAYPEGMAFTSIYFALDKSTITAESYKEISRVAMYMKANPNVKIIISGNTDLRASNSYNDALSARRTQAAMDVLVNDFGIDASRLVRENLGEKELLSKKHHINRRVDFFIK